MHFEGCASHYNFTFLDDEVYWNFDFKRDLVLFWITITMYIGFTSQGASCNTYIYVEPFSSEILDTWQRIRENHHIQDECLFAMQQDNKGSREIQYTRERFSSEMI